MIHHSLRTTKRGIQIRIYIHKSTGYMYVHTHTKRCIRNPFIIHTNTYLYWKYLRIVSNIITRTSYLLWINEKIWNINNKGKYVCDISEYNNNSISYTVCLQTSDRNLQHQFLKLRFELKSTFF